MSIQYFILKVVFLVGIFVTVRITNYGALLKGPSNTLQPPIFYSWIA